MLSAIELILTFRVDQRVGCRPLTSVIQSLVGMTCLRHQNGIVQSPEVQFLLFGEPTNKDVNIHI